MAFTKYQSRGTGTQQPGELNRFIPQPRLTLAEVTMVPEPIPLALLLEGSSPGSSLPSVWIAVWPGIWDIELTGSLYSMGKKLYWDIKRFKINISFKKCGALLQPYRHLCRVHEAQPKVVFLYEIQMVHDLLKQLLSFGFFLEEGNTSHQGKTKKIVALINVLVWSFIIFLDPSSEIHF